MLQLDKAAVYQLFRDFYALTQIRIVLLDNDFQEILAYPEERVSFCAQLRSDPQFDRKCALCDRASCEKCAKKGELVLYPCHAGLLEAVAPITDSVGVIGYVMFGQALPKEQCDEAKAQLLRRYPERKFRGISKSIDEIPIKSAKELRAAATVLQALTAYVLTKQWVAPVKSEFIRRLDAYIEAHLREPITVEDICRHFQIGRTRIYTISTEYLGCGIAEYIRRQRLNHANRLLSQTNLPIAKIADLVGFSDYNHFSKTYKQEFGFSAREYRQKKHPHDARGM